MPNLLAPGKSRTPQVDRCSRLAEVARPKLIGARLASVCLDVGENVFEFEFGFVDFEALQAIAVFE